MIKEITSIQLDTTTKNLLESYKIGQETYNSVVIRLINVYELMKEMHKEELGTKILEGF